MSTVITFVDGTNETIFNLGPSLTEATTSFTINAATPSKLVFITGANQNLLAGQFSNFITVQMQDQNGNPVISNSTVSINLSSTSTGGTFWDYDQLTQPEVVAVDSLGNVYVSTAYSLLKFSSSGAFLTELGSASLGSGNGQFVGPRGVAFDASGDVYVVDNGNNRVEEFTSSGAYLTQWGTEGSGNGQFNSPWGIAVGSSGNIYVSDMGNNRIEEFTSSGIYVNSVGN